MEKRVVLITGGSAGIGLATAQKFVEQGDQVIITGRNALKLEQVKRKLPEIYTISSDASVSEDRVSLFAEITQQFGQIDVLFANVGIGIFAPLTEMTEADFDHVVSVNYKGCYFTVQEALKLMPEGSRIIVNASWTHHRGLRNSTLYGSTKAAISHMVKGLASELAERNINVNAVSPGYINTEQFNEGILGEDESAARKAEVPLQRFGRSREIADMVYFLASQEASYVNAQDIIIDGGLTAVHCY
ncbi:TPA: SDR family NAD(P)-dependent oxidoreductase [Vibrio alginolyticus]